MTRSQSGPALDMTRIRGGPERQRVPQALDDRYHLVLVGAVAREAHEQSRTRGHLDGEWWKPQLSASVVGTAGVQVDARRKLPPWRMVRNPLARGILTLVVRVQRMAVAGGHLAEERQVHGERGGRRVPFLEESNDVVAHPGQQVVNVRLPRVFEGPGGDLDTKRKPAEASRAGRVQATKTVDKLRTLFRRQEVRHLQDQWRRARWLRRSRSRRLLCLARPAREGAQVELRAMLGRGYPVGQETPEVVLLPWLMRRQEAWRMEIAKELASALRPFGVRIARGE